VRPPIQEFKQNYPRPGWVPLRTVPTYTAWLDVLQPISRVFPIAGLDNTMRGLVVSGTPLAVGLRAMGDSMCTTTATVGGGLSLPLSGTVDLLDTISAPRARTAARSALVTLHMEALLERARSELTDHNERAFLAQGRSYGASMGHFWGCQLLPQLEFG
jgi:hypothetical protein